MTGAEMNAASASGAAPADGPLVDLFPNKFMLILADSGMDSELQIAGSQHPFEMNEKSPAHLVGKWLRDHLEEIIFEVRLAITKAKDAAAHDAQAKQIITGDRERTIVGGQDPQLQLEF